MTVSHSAREHLLLEAILSATNVAIGLTAIRRHDFSDKGSFYAGMFSLSIGIERLLKLVIVTDYVQASGSFPTNGVLKHNFGHEIDKLVESARLVNSRRKFGHDETLFSDQIVSELIVFLARFAKVSRYYNLDFITGATKPQDEEPLQYWTKSVVPEILRRHHRLTKKMKAELAHAQSLRGARGIVIDHIGDDGAPIQDIESFVEASLLVETKQKYAVYYIHKLVMFGIELLESLDAYTLGISEPYRSIWSRDKRTITRRRTWTA